jgi:hypothetical protein
VTFVLAARLTLEESAGDNCHLGRVTISTSGFMGKNRILGGGKFSEMQMVFEAVVRVAASCGECGESFILGAYLNQDCPFVRHATSSLDINWSST